MSARRQEKAAGSAGGIGPSPKRCAVYCRKSTEEGLDQEFNSIDAQREAGHAYIVSQRHEGWVALTDGYTDPGFSGGNMQRPGLKRLMADIEKGRIDIVVVYKIDRLTRSLTDFSRMIEVFERNKVSFVSVTQQFNTTTSMGRLMLNVLLSFAQFEREITGERIRDKIAASKRKGMWMGGMPPLGYDVKDRRLIVNKDEAILVQRIFDRFVALRSGMKVAKELSEEGMKTKSWTTQEGRVHAGQIFTQTSLYRILRNRVYRGEIPHRETWYLGEHPAIVKPEVWAKVEEIIGIKPTTRANQARAKVPFLLKGLLFDQGGRALSPWHTRKKNGRLYRYYISTREFKEHTGASGLPRYPADQLEQLVIDQLRDLLRTPAFVQKITQRAKAHDPDVDEAQVFVTLLDFDNVWSKLSPAEQGTAMKAMIENVRLSSDSIQLRLHELEMPDLIHNLRSRHPEMKCA